MLTSSPTCHSSAYARSEAANSIIKSGVNRILTVIQLARCWHCQCTGGSLMSGALIRKRNSSYVCNNPEGRGPLSIITWAIKRHTPSISFCSTRQERSPSLLCNDRVKSHLPISFTSWTISKLNCPNVTQSVLWHFYIGNSLANNCWDFATTCLLLWSIG